MRVKANEELPDKIQTGKRVRQGDSLNSTHFNLIMDEIIKDIERMKENRIVEVCLILCAMQNMIY